MSEILLPPNAPAEYADRETLWNSVESAERRNDAQLAYSFEFSLQNEFTLEENEALARQFIQDNFVSRGMIADFAIHNPDRGERGNQNPHVHVMCPMRPLNEDGTWGNKQKRIVLTDENGEVVWDDQKNCPKYTAVRTTDWSEPETLERWRQNWADLCNAKFAQKGLDVRIDNRSYERQGIDQLPQIHEGPTVRAMEKKGIPTEKGAYNRWVRASNEMLKSLMRSIAELKQWIQEVKKVLNEPQAPTVMELLIQYMDMQKAGAQNFSYWARQKAQITTLKDVTDARIFLLNNNIVSTNDLENRIYNLDSLASTLRESLKGKSARITLLRNALEQVPNYCENLTVFQELSKPKYRFKKAADAYKAEHDWELKLLYKAKRILKEAGMPMPFDPSLVKQWETELAHLQQSYEEEYQKLIPIKEEQKQLHHVQYCVNRVLKKNSPHESREKGRDR